MVNEVKLPYNAFGQLTTEYQEHDGAVNTSTTPTVQYAFADGSDNHIRPTSITYPSGRVLTYRYGTAGGSDDAASRMQAIKDGTLALERLGTSSGANTPSVWGRRYVDDLLLRDRGTTAHSTLDERFCALQDANCNVTAVADDAGVVQE